MKIFTIATKPDGYFDLLKQTAQKQGYDLQVLGWQQTWKGFAWKIALYVEALEKLPAGEPVICADGYDVVAIAPAREVGEKFRALNHPMVFSDQRYFPNQPWIQKIADQVMSNGRSKKNDPAAEVLKKRGRPCMGLLVAHAGALADLFRELLKIERENKINDDQTLLNIYYLKHPDSIFVDEKCAIFQNLWRTRGGLYGKISSKDPNCEVEVFFDETTGLLRLRNKHFGTTPCLLHAPFNLNMSPLLRELGMEPPDIRFEKDWHYWRYSILHHVKRAIRLYWASRKAS
ncbi:MAG: hypothetical protein D6714_21185 [Bacteroidetes bacterium]|nr:MAG: hypothetical protein D6714_21185 [Bacteroidota bacterium]